MECLVSKNRYPSDMFVRNVAKLVVHDKSRGLAYQLVYDSMKNYYRNRCEIAHNLGIMDPTPIIPEIENIREYSRICINECVEIMKRSLDPLKEAEKMVP